MSVFPCDFSGLDDHDPISLAVSSAFAANPCRLWTWRGDGGGLVVRRAAPQYAHQAGRLRMRNRGCGRLPAALQRALLYGGDALHFVRRGNGLHDALGGDLPQVARDDRLPALRLLGDGCLPGLCGRGALLYRAQGHPELEPGQGGPLVGEALKKTLAGRAAVLEGLPEDPAVKAILAWKPEALVD